MYYELDYSLAYDIPCEDDDIFVTISIEEAEELFDNEIDIFVRMYDNELRNLTEEEQELFSLLYQCDTKEDISDLWKEGVEEGFLCVVQFVRPCDSKLH